MLATIMFLWLAFSVLLAAQQPVFDREVRPILERNCLGCHNQKLKMSNFSIATRTELLKGGKRGGSPARILEAIRQEGNLRRKFRPPGIPTRNRRFCHAGRHCARTSALAAMPSMWRELLESGWPVA